MKKISTIFYLFLIQISLFAQTNKFISVKGKQIIGTDGKEFLIRGTNLGNWLVPEGYMFKFNKTTSPRLIQEALTELVGPDEVTAFWKKYLANYITEADIHFIKSIGMNSIRVPFNYRLFTEEEYLGGHGEALDADGGCPQGCRDRFRLTAHQQPRHVAEEGQAL